jgi:hypothetical protein
MGATSVKDSNIMLDFASLGHVSRAEGGCNDNPPSFRPGTLILRFGEALVKRWPCGTYFVIKNYTFC